MSTSVDKSGKKQRRKSTTTPAVIPSFHDSDDDLSYEPPPGAVLIDTANDGNVDEFDWDELKNNEDLELWVMRIPNTV